ncbi:hypothetical protein GCM10022221_06090 [Actinocorallia aurea]
MTTDADEHGLTGPENLTSSGGGQLRVQPEVNLLEAFLDEVHAGQLRVPKFQRPFVWRPEQMLDLFDSIERGYPIGSVLLWKTNLELESLKQVGGLRVPESSGSDLTYVLDGHQRLSTMYSCLYRRGDDGEEGPDDWKWRVYRVLGAGDTRANRYVHWRKAAAPPDNYLPMRSVLKTLDFLSYARRLGDSRKGPAFDALIEEAEQVAQRIKSYKISVVKLLGGDLSQAVEVFSRVNSKGQEMSPDQMVSALTYAGGSTTLADSIDGILERIEGEGFGRINSTTGFRALLAVAGEEEVTGARWDVLARRVEGKIERAVRDTDEALSRAVAFLRTDVGVPLARLVPYPNAQLMLLAQFFHLCPEPTTEQRDILVRWFWITSWSGHFASVNSTTSRQSIQDMWAFAEGQMRLADFEGSQGMFDFADQRPRPFPERFDLRSARVRAYVVWEMNTYPIRRSLNGREYSAVDVIRDHDTAGFRKLVSVSGLTNGPSPGNRAILETNTFAVPTGQFLQRSLRLAAEDGIVGMSPDALALYESGAIEEFVSLRASRLAEQELAFINRMGVVIPAQRAAEPDIDTE